MSLPLLPSCTTIFCNGLRMSPPCNRAQCWAGLLPLADGPWGSPVTQPPGTAGEHSLGLSPSRSPISPHTRVVGTHAVVLTGNVCLLCSSSLQLVCAQEALCTLKGQPRGHCQGLSIRVALGSLPGRTKVSLCIARQGKSSSAL